MKSSAIRTGIINAMMFVVTALAIIVLNPAFVVHADAAEICSPTTVDTNGFLHVANASSGWEEIYDQQGVLVASSDLETAPMDTDFLLMDDGPDAVFAMFGAVDSEVDSFMNIDAMSYSPFTVSAMPSAYFAYDGPLPGAIKFVGGYTYSAFDGVETIYDQRGTLVAALVLNQDGTKTDQFGITTFVNEDGYEQVKALPASSFTIDEGNVVDEDGEVLLAGPIMVVSRTATTVELVDDRGMAVMFEQGENGMTVISTLGSAIWVENIDGVSTCVTADVLGRIRTFPV